jgi:hypothetical protein
MVPPILPMKCFYDPAQDAVGACKSCGKGLSVEYAVDLGKGLACKGRCEKDVRDLIELVDNNVAMRGASKKIIGGVGSSWMISSSTYFLLGCFVIYVGWQGRRDPEPFVMVLGALFLIYAAVTFFRGLSIQRSISAEARKP